MFQQKFNAWRWRTPLSTWLILLMMSRYQPLAAFVAVPGRIAYESVLRGIMKTRILYQSIYYGICVELQSAFAEDAIMCMSW